MRDTVAEDTIAIPAEWAPQKAIWTAWPADPEQWNGGLETPRRDVVAMVRAHASSLVAVRPPEVEKKNVVAISPP